MSFGVVLAVTFDGLRPRPHSHELQAKLLYVCGLRGLNHCGQKGSCATTPTYVCFARL
jgi:hypothetical protein